MKSLEIPESAGLHLTGLITPTTGTCSVCGCGRAVLMRYTGGWATGSPSERLVIINGSSQIVEQ